jgi:hypothetical protein|tara:strand:- start:4824 stop:5033 length:210 start_codon:yes stop_codon:yes gene_type:complete
MGIQRNDGDRVTEFQVFMDQIAKSPKYQRNAIINDWLTFLSEDEQVRLINKLRVRGIEYIPSENPIFRS